MFQSAIRIISLILISTLLISCKSQVASSNSEAVPPSISGEDSSSSSGNVSKSASVAAPLINKPKVQRPERVTVVAAVSAPVHASLTGVVE